MSSATEVKKLIMKYGFNEIQNDLFYLQNTDEEIKRVYFFDKISKFNRDYNEQSFHFDKSIEVTIYIYNMSLNYVEDSLSVSFEIEQFNYKNEIEVPFTDIYEYFGDTKFSNTKFESFLSDYILSYLSY